MHAPPEVRSSRRRVPAIDVARAAALAAMAAFHTTWDFGHLRLTPENYALTEPGRWAAHLIAGSFLTLVGVGLVLMNGSGVRWRPTLVRFARIAGAAALITLATAYAFPDSFIFFGVLHCIAAASLLGLPFLSAPLWVAGAGAATVLALPHVLRWAPLDRPELFFLGLGAGTPNTNDYVPLFPWFGLVLAGIVIGRLGLPGLRASALGAWEPRGRLARGAAFAGRHSLALYLVHQPVLLGLLSGLALLTGPNPRAELASFRADYARTCQRTGGEAAACRLAARCTADALLRDNLWKGGAGFGPGERALAQALSQTCYAAALR